MTLYPEVKKKAQDELDRVIGRGRPPKIDDIGSLPYNAAIIKEVLRWKPPAPMGTYLCVPSPYPITLTYSGWSNDPCYNQGN